MTNVLPVRVIANHKVEENETRFLVKAPNRQRSSLKSRRRKIISQPLLEINTRRVLSLVHERRSNRPRAHLIKQQVLTRLRVRPHCTLEADPCDIYVQLWLTSWTRRREPSDMRHWSIMPRAAFVCWKEMHTSSGLCGQWDECHNTSVTVGPAAVAADAFEECMIDVWFSIWPWILVVIGLQALS